MPQFRTLASGLQPVASYQVIMELARGGMGSVHLARSVGIGGFERLVVIKRLLPHLLRDEEAVQRFLAEARNGACVRHANVVGIHQVGQDDEGYFLVLDYVEGAGVDEVVQRTVLRRRKLPLPIALRIALDATAGLEAVHQAREPTGRALGMLHRDVSLENLLVGCDGITRLADFGISRSVVRSIETSNDLLLGKLLYLAPEYLNRLPVGPTLDVYALGVTLWMMLTGRDPWPEANESKLMLSICDEGLPPLGTDFPPAVAALVAQACQMDPLRRFGGAAALGRAIEAAARGNGGLASQGEVTTYIQSLMGVDLVRRRKRVAERIEKLEAGATQTHTSMPAPPHMPSPSTALPVHWRPRRVAWMLAAAVASALVAWLVVGKLTAPPPPSALKSAPAAEPAPSAALPVVAAPAPIVVAVQAAPVYKFEVSEV